MRNDKDRLEKLLECIDRVNEYTKEGKVEFLRNHKTQDAVVRNFQIIGDVIKDLSDELRAKHSDVDWSEWTKSRDKITHDYFGVDYEKVWIAIEKDLSPLAKKIKKIHLQLADLVLDKLGKPSKLEKRLQDKSMH